MKKFTTIKAHSINFTSALNFAAAGTVSPSIVKERQDLIPAALLKQLSSLIKTSRKTYKSRILKSISLDEEIKKVCRLYQNRFNKKGIQVCRITPEIIDKITDADASIKAVLYRINIIYSSTSIIPNGSMD